jgi:lipid-binding SYLF domain-containing protein
MRCNYLVLSLVLVALMVVACARPKGETPGQKKDFVLQMKNDTLAQLYAEKSYAKELLEQSAGYAVFSNFNTQLLVFGSGNGYGVAVDNSNGNEIFMRMAEGGIGLGVALKDFKEVIVFNNKTVFYKFITEGWNYSAQGDAAAKYKDDGGSTSAEVPLDSEVVVFQMTKNGIALRANLSASKFWIDDELNNLPN